MLYRIYESFPRIWDSIIPLEVGTTLMNVSKATWTHNEGTHIGINYLETLCMDIGI